MIKSELTLFIKNKAYELGFDAVGVAKVHKLKEFEQELNNWLSNGYHGAMDYMSRNKEKRVNPAFLVDGAKSIVSLLVSYYPKQKQPEEIPQIAKYAYGKDYHDVLKAKMRELWGAIEEHTDNMKGRIFTDSAPVADRQWAVEAGLGWIGKNGCLINKKTGSFTFIAEMIIDKELVYDTPFTEDYCGSCTRCIDACPTSAIVEPGVIDSNRCISYLTIENRTDTIPDNFLGKLGNRIFGCDTCQDVCPWNKLPLTTQIKEFTPKQELFTLDIKTWQEMTPEQFNKLFKGSPLKRAKFSGLKRNLNFISK